MTQLTNTSLRGIRISPAGASGSIHYYVCVIDQPQGSSFDPSKVSIVEPIKGDTTLKFTYDGTLQDNNPGDLVWTFVLPVYTSQDIAHGVELSVIITDNSPEENYAKGNPNSGRPPIVQPVDTQHDLTPSFVFLKCQTGSSAQTLIMGTIVNTNFYLGDGSLSNGGYTNSFIITEDNENNVLTASLNSSDGIEPVAAYGIISCMGTWQYYNQITINGGDQSKTTPIAIPESWHSF